MADPKTRVIITSTPRSGTGWMAQVLRAMGISCGHEQVFNAHYKVESWTSDAQCESSWMAAPFLRCQDPDTIVVHLVRDPLKTIASLIATNHFDDWEGGKDQVSGNPVRDFIRLHMLDPYPDGTVIERAAMFWSNWHELIGRQHPMSVAVHIEDPAEWLPYLYRRITGELPIDEQMQAMWAVPKNVNTQPGRLLQPLTYDMLPRHVVRRATLYGYVNKTNEPKRESHPCSCTVYR